MRICCVCVCYAEVLLRMRAAQSSVSINEQTMSICGHAGNDEPTFTPPAISYAKPHSCMTSKAAYVFIHSQDATVSMCARASSSSVCNPRGDDVKRGATFMILCMTSRHHAM
jgi:hypothetical protein